MTNGTKIKVLLVDDEPHVRLMIKGMLMTMNCQVVAEAGNGRDALALYRQFQPHVTLMDINMPIMDGLETLKALRDEFPQAFVVMLSSLASMKAVEECLDAGAANYIRKDTPLTEMKQMLRESWRDHMTLLQQG